MHTTTDLPLIDRAVVAGVPVTSATRTIVDLAAIEPADRLTVAVDSAIRDGRTSEDHLRRRASELRGRGRPGVADLIAVLRGIEVTRGGHSWLEREFLRLAAAAGLPLPMVQQVLGRRDHRLIRVDVHFPGTPVVVELLGYAFHRSKLQLQDDAARANRLLLDGYVVLQFTYDDVVSRPDVVISTIREAMASWGATVVTGRTRAHPG